MHIESKAVCQLWGKKGKPGDLFYLPLPQHLSDTAEIATILWNEWLSPGVRNRITRSISQPDKSENLVRFLAAAHDLGKATPVFQAKQRSFPADDLDERLLEGLRKSGLECTEASDFLSAKETPHALATEQLLLAMGCDPGIAAILGSHHGKPVTYQALHDKSIGQYPQNYHMGSKGKAAWIGVQEDLLAFILRISGVSTLKELPLPDFIAQVLLTGLIIMADWIASNEALFPYFPLDGEMILSLGGQRAMEAWSKLNLNKGWMRDVFFSTPDYYKDRFSIAQPYLTQLAGLEIAQGLSKPGILVLEAPMGSGKTEAALVISEVFAEKAQLDGVFFALPTQATSNAMFSRLLAWTKSLGMQGYTLRLAHGKAQFNDDYTSLLEGSRQVGETAEAAVVHQWFEGNKKSLLADFVVGTIDQFLMASLKQKHIMLRHLGLAGKVVILDECHAYDAYMNQYLDRSLAWMGAYHVPVIVLSATLPAKRRTELICAYLGKASPYATPGKRIHGDKISPPGVETWAVNQGYPLITWTDGCEVYQRQIAKEGVSRQVKLEHLEDNELVERLKYLLENGGRAGVIVNTVNRAQAFAQALAREFGQEQVTLIHSRFIVPDRIKKEEKILGLLGKNPQAIPSPGVHIVVGTQVIEQSLDLDFDVLVSDLCPMDLLLQRLGRLHRHSRPRPQGLETPLCCVLGMLDDGFEPGAVAVYHPYPLMRTKDCLPESFIHLPEDIPILVQAVYDGLDQLQSHPTALLQAKADWDEKIKKQQSRAKAYRLGMPHPQGELTGWLDMDLMDALGEAAVRDGEDSIEVLLVCCLEEGLYAPLPWIVFDEVIDPAITPNRESAIILARQSVRLPHVLCYPSVIDQTITALEALNKPLANWQASPWLKGLLFLPLDENLQISFCGYQLQYSRELGLTHQKEGSIKAQYGV